MVKAPEEARGKGGDKEGAEAMHDIRHSCKNSKDSDDCARSRSRDHDSEMVHVVSKDDTPKRSSSLLSSGKTGDNGKKPKKNACLSR